MTVDMILDANIPKKVKRLNGGTRTLHVGDIDTEMKDEEVITIINNLGCLFVTHDRALAQRVSKKHKALFIKENLPAGDIVTCLEKNKGLLKTASIFCENGVKCKNCQT